MKSKFYILNILLFLSVFFTACEEEFVPDDIEAKKEYVVEGHIESSDADIPAYIILSKSISYFSDLNIETFKSMYVDDADVYIDDGNNQVKLKYVCINDLPFTLVFKMVSELAGKIYNPDFCFYIDIENKLSKKPGNTYNLKVIHEGDTIKASTVMPKRVNIDSLHFEEPPGQAKDSFALLWGTLKDPPDEKNFYRYFIKENLVKTYSYNSLRDDKILNGQEIKFPFPRPVQPGSEDFNFENGNLYKRGDTIQFKFCSISESEYTFWTSFEVSKNQGIFSSYIRPKDNIDGGIGVWGGQNCQIVNMIVPEK
jgi:hypothetical protein